MRFWHFASDSSAPFRLFQAKNFIHLVGCSNHPAQTLENRKAIVFFIFHQTLFLKAILIAKRHAATRTVNAPAGSAMAFIGDILEIGGYFVIIAEAVAAAQIK